MIGDKRYELSNHLGNVLVVVSDKKVPLLETPTNPFSNLLSFNADVLSYNDYYPFGMLIPNRHSPDLSRNYRYGFQGQEMDNELKGRGNSLNYTFRMHDPRVGRFFATDPLEKEYPWYTPYQFSGNKVIQAKELEGLEELILNGKMIEYGEMFFDIISNDEVLVKLYDRVQDNTKCHIKLYITSIDPSKINKSSNWGATTYDSKELKVMANQIIRAEAYFKQIKEYNKENGKKTKPDKQVVKTYDLYKSIFDSAGLQAKNVLKETKYDFNLIIVNENSFDESKTLQLMNNITHEVDAHFEETINGNENVNNSHHFQYFLFSPYAKNVTDEEKEIINSMKKGYSPPVSSYKEGSEAQVNQEAITKAIEKYNKKQEEKKKVKDEE